MKITEFAVYNEEGEVTGVEGIAHDITEQKKIEDALRSSEERLKLGQSAAGIGIWDLDMRADEGTCSGQYIELYGLSPKDLPRRGDDLYPLPSHQEGLKLIHSDDRQSAVRNKERAVKGEGPYELEYRVTWPDGTLHWLLSKAKTFFDESGRCTRLIGVNRDVTEKKRVEEELRQSA